MGARLGRRPGPEAGSEAGAEAGCGPAPYERRVRWLREIQSTLRERRPKRPRQMLRLLRQDLGLEGTLLTGIFYRNVAFLNLVDPISHDLLVNLARDLQCPKSRCPRRTQPAAARELTEAIKDTTKFPVLARVGLGNNVDVASLPQPLLVGLSRRLSQRTSLPTIYESLDPEPEGGMAGATDLASTWGSAAAGPGPEPQACCTR
ncbi:hypothetical protein EI555_009850 [Monodon monoceros]|uniref:Uncharacterized protein n=1 Tax=Monodon monoceros TaxID=40151 RepID=A0A4U1F0G5_MONMO|nr:hypothetical protein EI555_009850 [Monodon monoceros]